MLHVFHMKIKVNMFKAKENFFGDLMEYFGKKLQHM